MERQGAAKEWQGAVLRELPWMPNNTNTICPWFILATLLSVLVLEKIADRKGVPGASQALKRRALGAADERIDVQHVV